MDTTAPNLWDQALTMLRSQVDEEHFATWLGPTFQHSFDNSTLIVYVPNELVCNWLSSHYREMVHSTVNALVEKPVEITFKVNEEREMQAILATATTPVKEVYRTSRLNNQYTFNTFIVGESNRFAHLAAKAVADHQTVGYNPLFIYGGSGLGKTHLMHAIGNEFCQQRKASSVLYVSSEEFMNSFIHSTRQGNALDFRNYYRNVDLLLIDDVHFLVGKEGTQVEFFHTFNALYEAGKKIVVSSDRTPKELNIEERLKTRFEWGLIVDVQPPDLQTRVAILQAKAEIHQLDLPYDYALQIAERVKTSVRKLEGIITLMKARSSFSGCKFTQESINNLVAPFMVGEVPKRITPEIICRVVCDFFTKGSFVLEISDLIGKSRIRNHAMPRHIAMYLCRTLGHMSFPEIGLYFGKRDHTTVMHACNLIHDKVNKDANIQNTVTYVTHRILENSGA